MFLELADGPQIDWFTIFADAAAPAQANRVQDILLALVAHEFEQRLAEFRLTSGPAAAPFLTALDAFAASRLADMQAAFPDRYSPASDLIYDIVQWRHRQARLIVLAVAQDTKDSTRRNINRSRI